MWPLRFLVLSCLICSAAIQGPKEVSGYVGGSLTVTCNYEATFEKYRKSWCFGETWSSCRILVETAGTEQGMKKDRVTLRDSQRDHRFTVTMERLRLDDADTYWCGIERVEAKQVQVTVALGAALTTRTRTTTTRTMTTMTTTTWASTSPASPEETTYCPSMTGHPHNQSSTRGFSVSPLLSIIPAMLLVLLLVAAMLVWRKLKTQRSDPGVSLKLDAQEEELTCYAHLTLHSCDQDSINVYENHGMPSRASRSPEVATEYSSIRKPKTGL